MSPQGYQKDKNTPIDFSIRKKKYPNKLKKNK
jgi:hypothetical protein